MIHASCCDRYVCGVGRVRAFFHRLFGRRVVCARCFNVLVKLR